MTDSESRARALVDRMLREAAQAERYVARGQAIFFDLRTPEIRDAVELRVLHFTESPTKLGKSFRSQNPQIPWQALEKLRNDLAHEYPEVKAGKLWKFAETDLPRLITRLRKATFPPGPE